jgi:broad specificity phosphatase PhoE
MVEASDVPVYRQVVWLCRHGNRVDFVDPSWRGTDPHLSPDGVAQAKETGARLRGEPIRHIFSSPFLRAVETAHHIAEALDLSIKVEHGACEWMNAAWFPQPPAYIPLNEMQARFPRVDLDYRTMVHPHHPETQPELRARCRLTADRLLDTCGTGILVVGHGASVTGLAWGVLGPNHGLLSGQCTGLCSLTKVVREDSRAFLELNGDTSHLTSGEQHRNKPA